MVFRCFVAGTQIRRPEGDVPVETLQVGDLVLTSSGEARPIKWIGHRDVDCRRYPDPTSGHPVRIAADAFGPNRPSQDLLVSNGHGICLDLCGEVLIPVGYLINGATIATAAIDEVSYWHVELDSHDILIANNLPAESYMDMDNRAFFEDETVGLEGLDRSNGKTHEDFCRPVAIGGQVLAFARERLIARAEAIGWKPEHDPDLRLLVDGQIHRPLSDGDTAVFMFPAAAGDVRLASTTFVPAHIGVGDRRELGICLFGLTFAGSGGGSRRVSIDDARLGEGLHDGEAHSGTQWRWTKGELVLDPQFWADMTGHVALFVEHSSAATRRWNAPSERIGSARPAETASVKRERRLYSVG
jgi:hypothetical protein